MKVQIANMPIPSGKKRKAAKKSSKKGKKSKMTKHQRIVNKNRSKRAGMTIAQCITLAIRNSGKKKGLVFKQIHACLSRSGVKVSKFILKNTLKKMMSWGVVKHTPAHKSHYKLTGKRCPSHLKNKHVNKKRNKNKKQRVADQHFRNKMNKVAKKLARGGRTMEHCVVDALKIQKKRTMNQLLALFKKQPGMKTSKFVIKHVLKRCRAKGVVKIYRGHYSWTGQKFPARKHKAAKNWKVRVWRTPPSTRVFELDS